MEMSKGNTQKNEFRDLLMVEGINAKGFGFIAKLAMLDRALTIESKAIYAYFCSYAGAGSNPFPSVKKIISDLGISEDRYYKHLAFLKALGYIKVSKRKSSEGKFTSNIYTLVSNPQPNDSLLHELNKKLKSKNKIKIEPKNNSIKPFPQNTGMEKPFPEIPSTDATDSENNGSKRNSFSFKNNNYKINNNFEKEQSFSQKEASETKNFTIDSENYNSIKLYFEDKVNYSQLKIKYSDDIRIVDEIILNIVDMYFAKSINVCGQSKSKELVRGSLSKLDLETFEYILEKVENYSKPIISKKAFIQSIIFNAPFEFSTNFISYRNELYHSINNNEFLQE